MKSQLIVTVTGKTYKNRHQFFLTGPSRKTLKLLASGVRWWWLWKMEIFGTKAWIMIIMWDRRCESFPGSNSNVRGPLFQGFHTILNGQNPIVEWKPFSVNHRYYSFVTWDDRWTIYETRLEVTSALRWWHVSKRLPNLDHVRIAIFQPDGGYKLILEPLIEWNMNRLIINNMFKFQNLSPLAAKGLNQSIYFFLNFIRLSYKTL